MTELNSFCPQLATASPVDWVKSARPWSGWDDALCLVFDDNPPTAGCVTTAVAMGDNLMARLVAAGIVFETVD